MNSIGSARVAIAVLCAIVLSAGTAWPAYGPNPNVNYDLPNYATSPLPQLDVAGNPVPGTGMRKFVDSLPGLTPAGTNNLGQYIPVGAADTNAYPGSDYYEIALVEYQEKMHSDVPPTRLRGYVQLETPANAGTSRHVALTYPGGAAITNASGAQVYAYDNPHYLGPLIIATMDRAVRIKFSNYLPVGAAGNLFIPVDTTVMGAGLGPDGVTSYTQNRATLHLHGGLPPWVSDGTPHQWTAPAGEDTPYAKGVSAADVPDMPVQASGSLTFYWPNQQSGRLMFYHDHAYGATGPDVYAGEAAGYLIVDPVERALTDGSTPGIPAMTDIPLVIQDKTFVWGTPGTLNPGGTANPGTGTWAVDPLWLKHVPGSQPGDLWYPHIYVPNQDPTSDDGTSPMGRWDYGPWFWPIFPVAAPLPELSHVPESFMDTPVINGTAYPVLTVDPKPYRFRILNACNDRSINLGFYRANPGIVKSITMTSGGRGYTAHPAVTIKGGGGIGATASAYVDLDEGSPTFGRVTSIEVETVGSGYTNVPTVVIAPPTSGGSTATAVAKIHKLPTEVGMVPANPPQNVWPPDWGAADGRTGGWPDPAMRGPALLQIGTEGGLLPKPAVYSNTPIDYVYDRRNVVVLSVKEHGLWMGPAERADVIVDFTKFAGKTLILYNDSPAPAPAGDPRLDYYTCSPDMTEGGGAPSILPGYGPNTRTMVQIKVRGAGGTAPVNDYNPAILTALRTALPAAFTATLDTPIVPQSAYNGLGYTYNGVVNGVAVDTYSRISNNVLNFIPYGATSVTTAPLEPKTIQELFDTVYGRMNALLGVELPFTSAFIQTTLPFGYIDPPTEIFNDGETQLWKITHNGVDTHAIHFHLVNVQVINRVGWDGQIRPPEANELGWKETVKMSPLEDIVVAMRATGPRAPFGVPKSIRVMDVTAPTGSTAGFAGVDPATGNPIVVTNAVMDFDSEYVWHCHLLGHEEFDMMRVMVFHPTVVPPAAPVANAVAGGAPPSLAVTWTDGTPANDPATLGNPANEIGFRILRAGAVGGVPVPPFVEVGTALANATHYTDATANLANSFSYRVVAYNAAGSVTSAPTAATAVVLPAAPGGLTAAPSGPPPAVALAWLDNTSTETGFDIRRAVNGGASASIGAVGANVTNYTDSTVVPGTSNDYWVVAVGPGFSLTSTPVAVAMSVTPAAPGSPTAVLSGPPLAVNLSWVDNSTGESGFDVRRATGAGAPVFLATVGPNVTNYTDSTTVIRTTYSYSIVAFTPSGSATSTTVSVTTPSSLPSAPSAATATASALSTNPPTVTVRWTDNSSSETGFLVERAYNGSFTGVVTAFTVPLNQTRFVDATVGLATKYYYRVSAFNMAGYSAAAVTLRVTSAGQIPLAPTGLTVGSPTSTSLKLDWTPGASGAPVSNYQIVRGPVAAGPWTLVGTVTGATTTFTDAGLHTSRTFYYKVRAVNVYGSGAYSSPSAGTTLP